MEFSMPECWSEQPFPSPGDLPDPGIKSGHPALQVDSLLSEPPGKPTFRLVPYLVTTSTIKTQNVQSPQKVPWGSSLPIPENTGQLSLTIDLPFLKLHIDGII